MPEHQSGVGPEREAPTLVWLRPEDDETVVRVPEGGLDSKTVPGSSAPLQDAAAIRIPGYEIKSLLSSGGMGKVYLAEQIMAGRRAVAIKVIAPNLANDADFRKRFLAEANCAVLDHPNIVRIYDVGDTGDQLYIAMEYLAGGELGKKLKEGVSEAEALKILTQIAHALEYAHGKNLVHRDVKAANVMFRADGAAVLTDFGIVKLTSGVNELSVSGLLVGSPHYMSPEQAQGRQVDHRSDLYSLGVVFYEMLTGKRPYVADSQFTIVAKHVNEPVPKLPAPWAKYQPLIDRMMAKLVEDRYPSASALIQDLKRFREVEPTEPPTGKAVPSRHGRWIWATLGGVIVAGAGGAWVLNSPSTLLPAEVPGHISSANIPAASGSAGLAVNGAANGASPNPSLSFGPTKSYKNNKLKK